MMKKHKSGSILIWAIVGLAVIGAAALIIPNLIQRSFRGALDEMKRFELRLLSDDINEFAKYLLLYEKVFYTERLTQLDGKIHQLWESSFSTVDEDSQGLMKACGGYQMNGEYTGEHTLGSGGNKEPVFCPLYLRSNMFSGRMIEQMLYEHWFKEAKGDYKKVSPGHYSLNIDLSKFVAKVNADDQDMVLLVENESLRKLISQTKPKATVSYEFFTESAGFRSMLSERYVRVTTELLFTIDERGTQGVVRSSDTMMMIPSTPKEFALFMPYPTKANGITRTSKWSESVILPSGSSDSDRPEIHGRVFFNGDMDFASFDKIPTFFDAVVISGNMTVQGKIPGPGSLSQMRAHFKKGLVTNFSANRFVLDDKCGSVSVSNTSDMKCHWTMPEFLKARLGANVCYDGTLTLPSSGKATYQFNPVTEAAFPQTASDCQLNFSDQTTDRDSLIGGGLMGIIVNSEYAFIASPVALFENKQVSNTPYVYGTLMAGHVKFDRPGARLYSFTALRAGLPGIENDSILQRINQQIATATAGVTVPLLSMPVVYSGNSSFLAPPVDGGGI